MIPVLRKTALLVVAVALAAGTGVSSAALLAPCHGDDYRHGVMVWDHTTQSWRRMCIKE